MEFKIYVLIDPRTNEIRYVGRTLQKLNNRLKQHLRAKDKSHRVNWIKSLTLLEICPEIKLIDVACTWNDCLLLEQYYINKYKLSCNLTNMTDGGDGSMGFTHSDETKHKMSKFAKVRFTDAQEREKLKISNTKAWNKLSENDKDDIKYKKQPNMRTIAQYDMDNNLITIFRSLREIERKLGYFRANITPCLRGIAKQGYGYIWKYHN